MLPIIPTLAHHLVEMLEIHLTIGVVVLVVEVEAGVRVILVVVHRVEGMFIRVFADFMMRRVPISSWIHFLKRHLAFRIGLLQSKIH